MNLLDSTKSLKKIDFIKVGVFLTWRAFQSLVVIPASMIGAVILVYSLSGDAPVKESIYLIHHWAETAVRPATTGHVLLSECITHNDGSIKPPAICDSTQPKLVSVTTFAESVLRQLKMLYAVLVVVSLAALFFVMPTRRFVGLSA